jgi:hypothetical protein
MRQTKTSSSSTRTPGSRGSSSTGPFITTPASNLITSRRSPSRTSTRSNALSPTSAHRRHLTSVARTYSAMLTFSMPIVRASDARNFGARLRHRSMSPGTRPNCPSPTIVAAWRTEVPPPGVPSSQRTTQHGADRAARAFSRMAPRVSSGFNVAPNRRASGLPEPMRSAATHTSSGAGEPPDTSQTPSMAARNVPLPPPTMTRAAPPEPARKRATRPLADGWSRTTSTCASTSGPTEPASTARNFSRVSRPCPAPEVSLIRSKTRFTDPLSRPRTLCCTTHLRHSPTGSSTAFYTVS